MGSYLSSVEDWQKELSDSDLRWRRLRREWVRELKAATKGDRGEETQVDKELRETGINESAGLDSNYK